MTAPTPTDAMVPLPATIRRVTRELADTFTVRLDLGRPFPFVPGQFNMLYLFGVGEVAISVSGDPGETDAVVHTIRAVGTVTRAMQGLKRGATLGVRGPFGQGWPVDAARGRDVVIVAGGLGLAPLRPVIYHLLREREAYGRIAILYGARTPDDLLYVDELERWRARLDVDVHVTVDRAPSGWHADVGVVTALFPALTFDLANAVALVCGPEVMMRFVARDLAHRGVSPDRLFLSMERNMKCAVGLCGHCQYGPVFVCKDGPVFPVERIAKLLSRREV